MVNIGTAFIQIVPSFKGIANSLTSGLKNVDSVFQQAGTKSGVSFVSGAGKSSERLKGQMSLGIKGAEPLFGAAGEKAGGSFVRRVGTKAVGLAGMIKQKASPLMGSVMSGVGLAAGMSLIQGIQQNVRTLELQGIMGVKFDLTKVQAAAAGKMSGKLYGSGVVHSAEEAMHGIEEALGSGFIKGDQIATKSGQSMMRTIGNIAKVMHVDMGQAAEMAGTMVRTGLAESPQEALEALTSQVGRTAMSFTDIHTTLARGDSYFKKFGFNVNETVDVLGRMKQAGVANSYSVVEAMESMEKNITNNMSPKLRKSFEGIGLDTNHLSEAFAKGGNDAKTAFKEIVDAMRHASEEGNPNLESVQKTMSSAGVEAQQFFNAITSGKLSFNKLGEGAQGSQKDIDNFNKRVEAAIPAGERLMNSINQLISTGLNAIAPALQPAINALQKIVNAISNFVQKHPGISKAIAGILLSFTALVVGINAGVKVFQTVGIAFKVLSTIFMSNPVFMIIGIAAAVAVGLIIANWGKIKPFLMPIWNWIKKIGKMIWEPIKKATTVIMNFIKKHWKTMLAIVAPIPGLIIKYWQPLKAGFMKVFNAVLKVAQSAWKGIVSAYNAYIKPLFKNIQKAWNSNVKPVFDKVKSAISKAFNAIKKAYDQHVKPIWDKFKSAVGSVVKMIAKIVGAAAGISILAAVFVPVIAVVAAVVAVIGAVVAIIYVAIKVWQLLKAAAIAVWNAIKTAWNAAKGFFSALWNGIKSVATTVWNAIKTVVLAVWNGIKGAWNACKPFFTTLFNAIKTVATTVWNAIKTVVLAVWNGIKTAWNAAKGFFSGLFNGIKSTATTVWNAIKSAVTAVWDVIKTAWNAATGFFQGLWDGIKNACTTAMKWIEDKVRGAIDGIKGIVEGAKKLFQWSLPIDIKFPINPKFPTMPGIVIPPALPKMDSMGINALDNDDRIDIPFMNSDMLNISPPQFNKSNLERNNDKFVKNTYITVNAKTNADPYRIAKDIAWELK